MNTEESDRQIRLDELDRFWKHAEDEIDLDEAFSLFEALPEEGSTDGFFLTPSQVGIVGRAVAITLSELLHRKSNREKM